MITYTYLSAFAAFSGSAAGMLTAVVSNWMGERRKHRARGELRVHSHRYKLYKEFIAEGAKLYADALVRHHSEISNLVKIYALIARMRVISSDEVIQEAEKAARLIIQTYLSPNRKFVELPEVVVEMDPLRDFSEACRREL